MSGAGKRSSDVGASDVGVSDVGASDVGAIAVEARGGVYTVLFSRGAKKNALTFGAYRELAATFERLAEASDARAVVLAGRGEAFCAGGDQELIIGELVDKGAAELASFAALTARAVRAIRALGAPVVAAVTGDAVGAGAVLAAACDLRIASAGARFGFVFPKVGLSGADMGASWLLPRLVGLGAASELLLFGELIGAERAQQLGLVNRVSPSAGEARELAEKWARKLARGPALAHATTKRMLEEEAAMSLSDALSAEARAQALCMAHPDFEEARSARREGRSPRFAGAPAADDGEEP